MYLYGFLLCTIGKYEAIDFIARLESLVMFLILGTFGFMLARFTCLSCCFNHGWSTSELVIPLSFGSDIRSYHLSQCLFESYQTLRWYAFTSL